MVGWPQFSLIIFFFFFYHGNSAIYHLCLRYRTVDTRPACRDEHVYYNFEFADYHKSLGSSRNRRQRQCFLMFPVALKFIKYVHSVFCVRSVVGAQIRSCNLSIQVGKIVGGARYHLAAYIIPLIS